MKRNFGGKSRHPVVCRREKNTRFFHRLVNGRRTRLSINKIQNKDGEWMEGIEQVNDAAIAFYQD